MYASLNNGKTLFKIPVKDVETGEESIEEVHAISLIAAAMDQVNNDKFKPIIRERLEFTPEEMLVLEHADLQQRVRNEIAHLRINYTRKLGIYQMTPERARQRQLERLYDLEEPKWIVLAGPVICKGCAETMPARTKVLQVRGGVCCDYSCFGRFLAAKQAHGG
jgi:hypothetical protein